MSLHSFRHLFFTTWILVYFFCALHLSFAVSPEFDDKNRRNFFKPAENLTFGLQNVPRRNRQLDVDVESKFRISANTIIRTGESRSLGARYINETVLSSNRDCLTWCLETPNCNAAVFEEQKVHSCYLFDCGSPVNFLCKFTSHNFFISSVLRVTQHSYELSQWGNQVKHEKELQDLRSNIISSSSSTPALPVDLKTVSEVSVTPSAITKPGNKCHHYQFMCLNNSECIAIYNVCDGIPQCPDASDESIDMNCPSKGILNTDSHHPSHPEPVQQPFEKTQVKNVLPHLPPPTTTAKNSQKIPGSNLHDKQKATGRKDNVSHKEELKAVWPNQISEGQNSQLEYYHHSDGSAPNDGLGSPFVHKHSQFVAANDPHVQNLNRWSSDYDQYPQHSISLEQQYNPYDNNYQRMDEQYLPNQLPPEYDSLKPYSGYRQDDLSYWSNQDNPADGPYAVEAELPQPSLHALNKQQNYRDKENLYAQQISRTIDQYPEIKHRVLQKPMDSLPSIPQSQVSDMDEYKRRRFPSQKSQPYPGYDESLQRQYFPDSKSRNYEASENMDDSMYSNDDLIRASIVSQLPNQEEIHHFHEVNGDHAFTHIERTTPSHSMTLTSDGSDGKEPITDDSLIIVKPTAYAKPVQRSVLDFKMSVTELYQSTTTHSREINSAILALVLGLIITVLLMILLACRMKTLRRRMSRKGRGLAHDADYLVNGIGHEQENMKQFYAHQAMIAKPNVVGKYMKSESADIALLKFHREGSKDLGTCPSVLKFVCNIDGTVANKKPCQPSQKLGAWNESCANFISFMGEGGSGDQTDNRPAWALSSPVDESLRRYLFNILKVCTEYENGPTMQGWMKALR
ncbi:uncharacterized protein LOC129222539 [Uloborus diversus]|uniref:uncharacterized protein LOC129222539 n=1 Tax=Uloborus diversus TaxID=327109 RepID=UPI0024097A15|nr:uncharacterized protein LOC129222539 [Uloborus diversus]